MNLFVPLALAYILLGTSSTHASCNAIPGATRTFRGAAGFVDRPFAGPGDFVELRPNLTCSPDTPAFASVASENIVTLVFRPPSGESNVVILATDCDALLRARQACTETVGATHVTCVTVNRDERSLDIESFIRDGMRRLRFRFPDTDGLVGTAHDDRTLSGPVSVAVSRVGDSNPLPCGLATTPCREHTGLAACIDELFPLDGTCDSLPDPIFDHFTALPPPNDYQAMCFDPSPPCTGSAEEIRFTTDRAGNILLPMDWRGILVGQGVPIARLLRGSSSVPAFPSGESPIHIPSGEFLASYAPEGSKLPPIFEPQSDPAAIAEATLFGSADAARTVLRIGRLSPTGRACGEGPNQGLPCTTSIDCSGDRCEAALPLFDFATRYASGTGPVVVDRFRPGVCQDTGLACSGDLQCPGSRCVGYRAVAQSPVPLDGLTQSESVGAFVVGEGIDGTDLNADGDTTDHVLLLSDRKTGKPQPFGTGLGVGRAVVRIHEPPFSYPAIAVHENFVAFLESEPLEANRDANGNGDIRESILRIFRLSPQGAVELAQGKNIAVDPALDIDGRSVAWAGRHLLFRMSEAANAHQVTTRVSVGPDGEDLGQLGYACPFLSHDGTVVAFDRFPEKGVYVANVGELGAQRILESPQLLSLSANGQRLLVRDNGNIMLFDLSTRTQSHIAQGTTGDGDLSANGRTAVIVQEVGRYSALVTFQTDPPAEVSRVRVLGNVSQPILSSDGEFVVALRDDPFRNSFPTLLPIISQPDVVADKPILDMSSAEFNVFLHDFDGMENVVFHTSHGGLVPADSNNSSDVFAYSLASGRVTRLSVHSTGGQRMLERCTWGDVFAGADQISADGKVAAFLSAQGGLVDGYPGVCARPVVIVGDPPGIGGGYRLGGVFRHDLLTGATSHVDVTPQGRPANQGSFCVAHSRDGRFTAFASLASDLVEGDTNRTVDVFTRGPDLTDCRADLNGDCDLADTLLQAIDSGTGEVKSLCPAGAVAIAGEAAAFLRPEAAGDAPGCPAGPDLNGDGDTEDSVLHLWRANSGVVNLARSGTRVVASAEIVAVLAAEASEGSRDLNEDGDSKDMVVQVYSLATGTWRNTRQAADAIAVSGTLVAFLTPETAQGRDLNGDGDHDDRVLQVFDVRAASDEPLNLGWAAEEFVLGEELLAFRTREAGQGNVPLNGDGKADDSVLLVYDFQSAVVVNTGQAVTPCRLEACDPRYPYRVGRNTVKFLTFEVDQEADLNGNGEATDLVLQTINMRHGQLAPRLARHRRARGIATPPMELATPDSVALIAAAASGVCTQDGSVCASDAQCASGSCFVPPGGCTRALETSCDPKADSPTCGDGTFCLPVSGLPEDGRCHRVEGPCNNSADCAAGAVCRVSDQNFQRLVAPLGSSSSTGAAFAGAGVCIESRLEPSTCQTATNCGSGASCERGNCRRRHGPCATNADCPSGSVCEPRMEIQAAADSDSDEIIDPLDNCPRTPNADQRDGDADSVGDACEGNEVRLELSNSRQRPGATACVTASLRSNGVATAGLISDLTVSPPLHTLECTSQLTGEAARSKHLMQTALPLGLRIEIGGDSAPLPPGPLFRCCTRISGTAAVGTFAIASTLSAFTPDGNPVSRISTAGGSVEVSLCSGDCDEDGAVTIADVVAGVDIALGHLPLSTCPKIDRDEDRGVGIEELVRAVLALGSSCDLQPKR